MFFAFTGSTTMLSDRVSNKPQIIQPACITPLNETGNNQSSQINVDNLPDKTIDVTAKYGTSYYFVLKSGLRLPIPC